MSAGNGAAGAQRDTGTEVGGRRLAAFALVPLAFLTILLGACSSDDTASTTSAPSTTASSSDPSTTAADAGAGNETAATIPAPAEDDPEPFGPVADPVGFDATASFGNGVTAEVTEIRAIEATAQVPGETSGPAVALVLTVTNGSDKAIDLGNVTADLASPDGASYTSMTAEPAAPFTGTVEPGASASATYVFRIAPEERADVRLTLRYTTDTPTVLFAGSVNNG